MLSILQAHFHNEVCSALMRLTAERLKLFFYSLMLLSCKFAGNHSVYFLGTLCSLEGPIIILSYLNIVAVWQLICNNVCCQLPVIRKLKQVICFCCSRSWPSYRAFTNAVFLVPWRMTVGRELVINMTVLNILILYYDSVLLVSSKWNSTYFVMTSITQINYIYYSAMRS